MSANEQVKIVIMFFGSLMGVIGLYDLRQRHLIKKSGIWVSATLHAVKRNAHLFGLGRPSYRPVFRFMYHGRIVYCEGYTAFEKHPGSIEQLKKKTWQVGYIPSGVKNPKLVHYTGPLTMRVLYPGPLVIMALCIILLFYE